MVLHKLVGAATALRPRPARRAPAPRIACVAVDDTLQATAALTWAVENLVQQGYQMHLVSVVPHVVGPYSPAEGALAPDLPPATSLEVQQWKREELEVERSTHSVLERCMHDAEALGVSRSALVAAELPAKGGASGVGRSIVEYAEARHADVVVVGSRGLGGLNRSVMALLGLGSVSEYLLQHMQCPVVVVKNPKGKHHKHHCPTARPHR